jgi:DNA-binding transcriptional MerR regulator
MEGEHDNLVPIGRFAFLTGLSRRALRLYDERGLLRPARVDDWTGYRFYSLGQLADAELIRKLRAVDLPLDEVRTALADPVRLDELLDRHEVRLRERATESERMLALLQELREQKEEPVTLSIELREVPVLRAACVEIHTALDRIGSDCGQAYERLAKSLGEMGIAPAGPALIGYPDEDFDPEAFHALIAFPVSGDPPADSGITMFDFAGGKAVVGTLTGPYEGLHKAWQEVHAWIAERGLRITAMPYEVYRADHMQAASPAEIETDIVIPVA